MRVYIAIDFDNSIKKYLKSISDNIKAYCPEGKFTELNNFHLTLRFIGEIDEIHIPKLKEILDISLSNINTFSLKISNLGVFSRKKTNILWLGIEENAILSSLYENLSILLQKNKIPFYDKGFMPHITLGRKVSFIDSFDITSFSEFNKTNIIINKISLMQSKEQDGKLNGVPIYTVYL